MKPSRITSEITGHAMKGNEYAGMDTPTLVKVLLAKLNCQYIENEDGSVNFVYQGEQFWANLNKDSVWVRIVDYQWYECPLDNLEEMSCMQKAINTVNYRRICTAGYAISKEDNKMTVYSKCDLIISPYIPAPDQYLAVWLGGFFKLKQDAMMEFVKEKQRIGLPTD